MIGMYTKRQIKIFQLLLKNTQGITGAKIAEALNVSVRTIRNDIVVINDNLKKENYMISSSKKIGYFITSDVIEPLKQLIHSNEEGKYNHAIEENRHFRILGKVIFEGKKHCSDLAEMLFVSEQTVYKEINKLKEVLKCQYNCSLLQTSGDFVWVDVSEEEIRQLLFKILKNFAFTKNNSKLNEIQIILNGNFDLQEYNMLSVKIKQYFVRQQITIDDESLYLVVGAVYIVIIRNRYDFRVEKNHEKIFNNEVLQLIRNLIQMGLEITENDIECLNSFLWTIKLTSHSIEKDNVSVLAATIMNEFCRDVMNVYNINLKESEQIIDNMEVHIEYMIRRLDNDFQLTNPIINEIKNKYPFSYEVAMLIVYIIYKYKNKYPVDDEISYIAIYIEYFLENVNTKLKAIIVSSSRLGVINIIKNWIQNNFYNQVEVVECMPMHFIEDYLKENKIDLIISTSQIDTTLSVPHYVIEGIPDKNDIVLVNNMVHKIKVSHKYESIIKKMFSKEFINIYDKDYNFEEIICEMGKQLKSHERIENEKEYVEDVLQREQNYPTTIGNSFMIPHPLITFARKTTVSVALMKKPIIYNNKEIKMIFLLAIENKIDDDVSLLFQFFKQIALDKEAFNKLLNVSSKDEFLSQLIYLSKNLH